jgi:tetratricopeptide (TPR) repeat protein
MKRKSGHRPDRVPAINPAAALPAKLQQANTFHQRGQLATAQALYEDILRVQPRHFDALHLLGVIAAQTKNPTKAAKLIGKAIEIDPHHAAAHCNRGTALQELGQRDAALASYDRAIAIKPEYAVAYINRGHVLRELKRWDAALDSYDRAIAIDARHAETYFNRGHLLRELKRLEEALRSYDQTLAINPRHVEACFHRGNVLHDLERWDAALASYDQTIAIDARHAEAHFNRGNVLKRLEQWDAALASYDRAIAIRSEFSEAHFNRGFVLKELGHVDAALASYTRAIAIRPDFAEGHHNRAIAWLLSGNFEPGWVEYEWRWKSKRGSHTLERRQFPQPLWLGKESLAGKTILLYSEQGLGDTLQFCRYAKRVAELGAKVILEVQPPLLTLLAGLEGISQLVGKGDALPDSDYQCPLLSLPLAFNITLETIPSTPRYLQSDAAKIAHWQGVLGEKRRPRIGLMWSGNPAHTNDHNRSIPLANLIDHLPADCQYIGLQKEPREADARCLSTNPAIVNFADRLTDFSDTAALCECMDLVISVDTSVAHLSAALGVKTWILVPFNPDWRWLLNRDDSPWYPSVTLYRQQQIGDWNGVLQQVAADLRRTFGSL